MSPKLPKRQAERRGLRLWRIGVVLPLTFMITVGVATVVFYAGWVLLGVRGLKPERRIDSETLFDLVKLSFGVVAGAGALVALVVAYRRQRVDEDAALRDATRLHTERFTTAVSQLGDESAAVRLGGVHALAGLADDAPTRELRQTCVDVLCAYLRLPYTAEADLPAGDAEARHSYLALREVRLTIIRLIRDHLRLEPDHLHSWQGHDLDFTTVTFEGGDFSGIGVSGGTISFSSAIFLCGTVDFTATKFSGGTVDFSAAQFSGGTVDFRDAQFPGGTVLFGAGSGSGGAVVSSGVIAFSKATFSGGIISFRGIQLLGGSLDFRGAQFSGSMVDFNLAVFSGGAANFLSEFSGGKVDFSGARFSGSAVDFYGSGINDNAVFRGGTVCFGDANFSGSAVNFRHAEFYSGGMVDFRGARFTGGTVDFSAAVFNSGDSTDFRGARFAGGAVEFSGTIGAAPRGLASPNGLPPYVRLPSHW
ncbi:pentapeptide repeat-containing protein [Streptomyces hyaluromycini]|uniref:Pentapeptide repeat-containing protein n=1 Tax=Streptomyces hyaluromycini TaxID=1377993 RepID=A0ABV1WTP1_9ACTN